jgi:transposase-like protein
MNLSNPIYTDENKAREHLEALRWPDGPVCPHCGSIDNAAELNGKSTRPGVYKCRDCRKPFSVTVGTVFERSKIPLNKWLLANHMLTSGKKGTSSHQIHRTLGVTYKTAWFMTHRIREAMAPAKDAGPIGGPGKSVEADETFLGKSPKTRKKAPSHAKPDRVVLSLVERGGSLRSIYLDGKTVRQFLMPKVLHDDSRLLTDGAQHYKFQYRLHESVDHSKFEWTRGDVHTNTLENFFSIFKRGLTGVYQHCGSQHLHRYLAEFDFRYNNRSKLGIEDAERANNALKGIGGKRLTYRGPHPA